MELSFMHYFWDLSKFTVPCGLKNNRAGRGIYIYIHINCKNERLEGTVQI